MTAPRRILIAQTSFLGDVVLTTPLAEVVGAAFPGAEIWWLVRPDAVALVAPLAGAGRVVAFDKRGGQSGIGGLRRVAADLRAIGFDAAIGVQRSSRTAFLLALAGIPLRIGFAGTLGAMLYHRRVRRVGGHARDRLLGLAAGLGASVPDPPPAPRLVIDPDAAARVEGWLSASGVDAADRLLVLAPGSAWATKRWPARHFATLGRLLVPRRLDRIAVVGAPEDAPRAREIEAAQESQGLLDFTGRTTTADLVALLARASLVVANDSAPAHVAAALGRHVVALFGPTVPAQGFAPLGPRVRIAERELACRPCSRHGTDRCPIATHECLEDLAPAIVAATAVSLLDAAQDPARDRPRASGGPG